MIRGPWRALVLSAIGLLTVLVVGAGLAAPPAEAAVASPCSKAYQEYDRLAMLPSTPTPIVVAPPTPVLSAANVIIYDCGFGGPYIVRQGRPVVWRNGTRIAHRLVSVSVERITATGRVTADASGLFDSGPLAPRLRPQLKPFRRPKGEPGGSFAFTFDEPGTYAYQCRIYPEMKGTVIVIAVPTRPATQAPKI